MSGAKGGDAAVEQPRRAHFIAVGGTGMGSLAGLLKARGIEVTGSDTNVYPPMSTMLKGWDISVMSGFRAEHIDPAADLIVVGSHSRRGLPRVVLGSVAERVARYAPCPVLVVRNR